MRRFALVAAVLVSLALAGCVPTRPVPPSMADEDIALRLVERVNLVWAGTGLETAMDRPEIEPELWEPVTSVEFSDCMVANGFENGWGTEQSGPGLRLTPLNAEPLADEQQLAFYECFARVPFLSPDHHT